MSEILLHPGRPRSERCHSLSARAKIKAFALLAMFGLAFGLEAQEPPAPSPAAAAPRNLLWDGGLETGFGNGFWTVVGKNLGPSLRSMWSEGVIDLKLPIASRCVKVEEGVWSLCAWIRRVPGNEKGEVHLELTNFNDPKEKKGNAYSRKFSVPPSEGWQRVGWTFEVKESLRPLHHVEVSGGEGMLVDRVSLTPGPMPENLRAAADLEAGFDVGEETRIYVDGEKRSVDLMIHNSGPTAKAKVKWAVYDHYEDLVKEGTVEEEFLSGKTVRRRLPLAELPWGGYRLASSVEGQTVLGDSLVSFLPKIDAKALPWLGADANFLGAAKEFTPRFMTRLGMNTINALSCSSQLGRWKAVNPQPDVFRWQDASLDAAHAAGMEVVVYLQGFSQAPDWARKWVKGAFRQGFTITDEKAFTEAYCAYAKQVIAHYGDRIQAITFDDESCYIFEKPEEIDQLVRIYRALRQAVRGAAAEKKIPFVTSTCGGPPEWMGAFFDRLAPGDLDYIAMNSNSRPFWPAEFINQARQRGLYPAMYRTAGVGQQSRYRRLSLPLDRPAGAITPMGLFVWQAMLHAWLNRPYGTENPKDGLLVNYGYYDLRLLQQCAYMPISGKTGVEFDNSPTLGMQAMAMMKHHLQGMRPVRDPAATVTIKGEPTANPQVMAYPFRNEKNAAIVLLPEETAALGLNWKFAGEGLANLRPTDVFGRPISVAADGSLVVRELPVYLSLAPEKLPATLAALKGLRSEPITKAARQEFRAGDWALEVNADLPGLFLLSRVKGGKKIVVLDRFLTKLPLTKPKINVQETRIGVNVRIFFEERYRDLAFNLSEQGCEIFLTWENNEKSVLKNTVSFRVGMEGAGRSVVIQEGAALKAGAYRADYGAFFPPPDGSAAPETVALMANGARAAFHDFATFLMPPSSGRGFSPPTGFLLKTRDGEALLESDFTLQPYQGGGRRGLQTLALKLVVE
ncbi:MAG: hypothetical protein IT578_11520 [Verrucomicrobiae bacterium]|nr:hypothetical protein [Verrucomicrobiae bacterium]